MTANDIFSRGVLHFFKWKDMVGEYYFGKSKLELTLGPDIWTKLEGRRVVDFGCGDGAEVVEIAQHGTAQSVIGLDINLKLLALARERAERAGVLERCVLTDHVPEGDADVIISIDAFEHFDDPESILRIMHALLAPGGSVLISFGPPWYHPWGAHAMIFPWAHMILSENAVMEWREKYKHDGLKLYSDGPGGVNRMTIARFERLVKESPFSIVNLTLLPIRKLRWAHSGLTREFTTACVRAELRKDG